jgi:hypothetical protein
MADQDQINQFKKDAIGAVPDMGVRFIPPEDYIAVLNQPGPRLTDDRLLGKGFCHLIIDGVAMVLFNEGAFR